MGWLLCKIGIHKVGPWHLIRIWHHGEYPWDKWTHLCHGYSRGNCQRCELPTRRQRRVCTGPIYTGPRQAKGGYDWSGLPEASRELFDGM